MGGKKSLDVAFDKIRKDLRTFIDLSISKDEKSWSEWISTISSKVEPQCWTKKHCAQKNCPAYKNECGRCWLIAGTMCSGKTKGKFAKKYSSCKECKIYRDTVLASPISEVEEHLIVLVHSLRTKQYELSEMATTDYLTELNNRRYFDIFIQSKIEEMKRSESRLFLTMIDINNFKKINDTQGHLFGDYILKECAKILKETTRKSDLAVRLGGDEFLIISQDDKYNNDTADLLIGRIEKKLICWNQINPQPKFPLSLSYGYSIFSADREINEALNEADKKMYADKARFKGRKG